MPNTLTKITHNFVDAKGYYAHWKYLISEDTGAHAVALAAAVASAVQDCSNALYNGGMGAEQLPQVPGELGGNFTYAEVEDKAVMTYVASDGSIHRHMIPAPIAAIFLADGSTVDKTNAFVVTLNQLMLNAAAGPTFVSTRGGHQYATFGGGMRKRVKTQRKINTFTLAADVSTPAE